MACPNTEDGFVMIAVELGSALAMVDFTKGERLVVWEVVTQMYGKAKLPEARVSPADVAARTNTERAMISKAVRSLVESNVLTAGREEQTYRLQKDYEKWDRTARKEDPETAEARVVYAVEAVARSNGKVPRTRPGRPKAEPEKRVSTDTDYQETRVSGDTHLPETRVSTDTVSVSLQTRERVSTDTALLLEELESIREKTPLPPKGGSGVVSDEKPATIPIQPPPLTGAPETYDELYRWVEAITKTPHVIEKLYILASGYPVDWVFHALRCCSGKNLAEHKWEAYANGCLIRWKGNKGISWEEVKRDTGSKHRDVGEVQTITPERAAEVRKRTYLGNTGTERF